MSKPISKEEALSVLRKHKTELTTSFGVTEIGLFGSVARGEARPDSDVDVVVKMRKPNLFSMVHIKESLEKELQRPVDIVRFRDKMNPYLKARIESEAIYA